MTKLPTNRGGSATLGEVTSIRSPCGSGSNATTPPRRPPVAARTRSPATAIPPTRPGPVLNSQTSCPDEASTATRRPSPRPTRAVPPTTTGELRRMNSLNWKSNTRRPSAGSNSHAPVHPSHRAVRRLHGDQLAVERTVRDRHVNRVPHRDRQRGEERPDRERDDPGGLPRGRGKRNQRHPVLLPDDLSRWGR